MKNENHGTRPIREYGFGPTTKCTNENSNNYSKLGGHSIYLFEDGFISLDYLWFVHHIIPTKIIAFVHVHTYVTYSNLTIPARNIIINLGQSGMLCALFWHALKLGSSNSVKCVPNWNPKQTYQKATFLHSLILQLVWFCFLTLYPKKTTSIPKLTFWQFLPPKKYSPNPLQIHLRDGIVENVAQMGATTLVT